MKIAVSLTLVLAVIMSSLPVAAQSNGGRISQSISREAARLVAGQRTGSQPAVDWSSIRKLPPGTEITVVTGDAQAGKRYVLAADDSELIALNVSDPAITPDVAKALRDTAAAHPEYFEPQKPGTSFLLSKRVSLRSEGVFAANQKVADRDQIVQRITRADVQGGAITITTGPRHVVKHVVITTLIVIGAGYAILGITCAATNCLK